MLCCSSVALPPADNSYKIKNMNKMIINKPRSKPSLIDDGVKESPN